MPEAPCFTIILPCFNAAATIETAIQSLRAQRMPDWELLAVDDGSTDDTLARLQHWARLDQRIHALAKPRRGLVATLQDACRLARGGYLARMDADDIAHPDRLARQQALLESQPDVALCGAQVRMIGAKVGLGRRRYARWLNALTTHDAIVRELFIECPIAHPAFAMRKLDYVAVGGYQDRGWPEDYDLVLRFWESGKKLANVPEVLLEWRDMPGRLSMHDTRYSLAQFRAIKRHYLFRSYLRQHTTFYQWGAGEVGKKWLREWTAPHTPRAVVDIHPRKVGKHIHGVPVIAPDDLPPPGTCFVLVLVGAPGARKEIRNWFAKRGYEECRDFLFLA